MPSTRRLTTPVGRAADNSAQAGRGGKRYPLARTRPATASAGPGELADRYPGHYERDAKRDHDKPAPAAWL